MRIVVALGGNAILKRGDEGTIPEQRVAIREAADAIARLAAAGHELILTHGNGPQVGRLMLQDEALHDRLPRYPIDVHVAETQGQLGYLLQQELGAALGRARAERTVATVVTQVVVDPADPAFLRPTKPVGPYLSKKGVAEFRARGVAVAEVASGGWRRVVASPEPLEIVEAALIARLPAEGVIPVAAGGGGIPVVREGNGLRGVGAVVDKDLTAALLVAVTEADLLVIATDVEQVVRGFGTAQAEPLERLTAEEAEQGVERGDFPRGSMGEKVLACARVARVGKRAVIGALERLDELVDGRAGTRVEG